MSEDVEPRNDELSLAELAATHGPVFATWRTTSESLDTALVELKVRRIRHMLSPDGDLIVHRNDADVARSIIARACGPDLEIAASTMAVVDRASGLLVTVYTAGDLHQANLIAARLRAADISAVLSYDPTLMVAAVFAMDATVRVQVSQHDVERASAELDGQIEDHGPQVPFRSLAWETPMRRKGSSALLIAVALWVLPMFVAFLFVMYQLAAP